MRLFLKQLHREGYLKLDRNVRVTMISYAIVMPFYLYFQKAGYLGKELTYTQIFIVSGMATLLSWRMDRWLDQQVKSLQNEKSITETARANTFCMGMMETLCGSNGLMVLGDLIEEYNRTIKIAGFASVSATFCLQFISSFASLIWSHVVQLLNDRMQIRR